MFASAIPELAELLGSGGKYSGSYKYKKGRHHVILCGFIMQEPVSAFLADFFHKDRGEHNVKVVVLNK